MAFYGTFWVRLISLFQQWPVLFAENRTRVAPPKLLILVSLLTGLPLLQGSTAYVLTPAAVVSNTGGQAPFCCGIQATISENGLGVLADSIGNVSTAPAGNQFVSEVTDWTTYFVGNPLHTWTSLNNLTNPTFDRFSPPLEGSITRTCATNGKADSPDQTTAPRSGTSACHLCFVRPNGYMRHPGDPDRTALGATVLSCADGEYVQLAGS